RVHEPELARDLLAETFASAIAGGPSFRGQTDEELSGWLWSIARNTLGDQRRREQGDDARIRRLGRGRIALSDREIERVEELAGIAELREAVAQRLSELPFDQREAVRLRVLDDLPYEEIARSMRTTADTARARVSRGLRSLNIALSREHRAWRQG
ncbi:MAG TPA: sigma-70 family RNA polymerase sigma factor, partial [Solirubrobacteraceae bacterium]|nr:sigma-70 family RNA polymerase sigma factor [Solirubrobacteraceae bacterium]